MTTNNGNDETQVGGTPATTPEEPNDNRKLWLIVLAVLLIGVLIGVGVAVAGGGDDKKEAADDTSTSTSTSSTSSTTLAPTTTTSTSGSAPSDDPAIDSYTGSKGSPVTCTAPAPDVSTPPVPINFTLNWTTHNTDTTELSVDGPGLYQSYGSSGSESFDYSCSDQTHTYVLTAKGANGPDAKKTITFEINDTSS